MESQVGRAGDFLLQDVMHFWCPARDDGGIDDTVASVDEMVMSREMMPFAGLHIY